MVLDVANHGSMSIEAVNANCMDAPLDTSKPEGHRRSICFKAYNDTKSSEITLDIINVDATKHIVNSELKFSKPARITNVADPVNSEDLCNKSTINAVIATKVSPYPVKLVTPMELPGWGNAGAEPTFRGGVRNGVALNEDMNYETFIAVANKQIPNADTTKVYTEFQLCYQGDNGAVDLNSPIPFYVGIISKDAWTTNTVTSATWVFQLSQNNQDNGIAFWDSWALNSNTLQYNTTLGIRRLAPQWYIDNGINFGGSVPLASIPVEIANLEKAIPPGWPAYMRWMHSGVKIQLGYDRANDTLEIIMYNGPNREVTAKKGVCLKTQIIQATNATSLPYSGEQYFFIMPVFAWYMNQPPEQSTNIRIPSCISNIYMGDIVDMKKLS